IQVLSTGTGVDAATISIVGYGGSESGEFQNMRGVFLEGATTVVGSVDGDMSIVGFGGEHATLNGNRGVEIGSGARVESTGTDEHAATITIEGIGGGTGASNNNHGIYFLSSAGLTSTDGLIVFVAERGAGTDSLHFRNDVGAGLVLNDSLWAAYLPDHENNTYGNLVSGNLPAWGETI